MVSFSEFRSLTTSISNEYYKLILLVGPSGSGKTNIINRFCYDEQCKCINLSQALSKKLKEIPIADRSYYIQDYIDEITENNISGFLIFDNTEIIFSRHLKVDPLRVFKNISRYRKTVVAWPGSIKDGYLTYAESWHEDYVRYSLKELECLYMNLERGI